MSNDFAARFWICDRHKLTCELQCSSSVGSNAFSMGRPDEPGSSGGESRWRYRLMLLLALGCGILTYSFTHIIKISHIHISLAHHHRTAAFCAFTGCKLTEDIADPNANSTLASFSKATSSVAVSKEDEEHLADTTRLLSARVCGSPAVDGYAHVVPKCLEESPTAKWWNAYYAGGGKQKDLVMHIEPASDYDGLAVFWGLNNKKGSAEECGLQCLNHLPEVVAGPYSKLPCNAFAWCPDDVCFEPDAHHHTKGDCWLKFTEGPAAPEVNMRGDLPPEYKARHRTAPDRVQWVSGVLLPPGVKPTNGSWSPRWKW